MSRESFVFILGLLVLLTPFLGVPTQWKTAGLAVIGALLMLIGYSLRRSAFLRSLDGGQGERSNESFAESIPDSQIDQSSAPAQAEKDSTPV